MDRGRLHVSIRENSATVMAGKVQDNKTNAVVEAQSMSTIVGAGGCVIYPRPFTALDCRRWCS